MNKKRIEAKKATDAHSHQSQRWCASYLFLFITNYVYTIKQKLWLPFPVIWAKLPNEIIEPASSWIQSSKQLRFSLLISYVTIASKQTKTIIKQQGFQTRLRNLICFSSCIIAPHLIGFCWFLPSHFLAWISDWIWQLTQAAQQQEQTASIMVSPWVEREKKESYSLASQIVIAQSISNPKQRHREVDDMAKRRLSEERNDLSTYYKRKWDRTIEKKEGSSTASYNFVQFGHRYT